MARGFLRRLLGLQGRSSETQIRRVARRFGDEYCLLTNAQVYSPMTVGEIIHQQMEGRVMLGRCYSRPINSLEFISIISPNLFVTIKDGNGNNDLLPGCNPVIE